MAMTQPYKPHKKTGTGNLLRAFLVKALLLAMLFRFFLFEGYRVNDSGMAPGAGAGDRLAVTRFAYGLPVPFFNSFKLLAVNSPDTGDRVVFYDPRRPLPGGFSTLLDFVTFSIFNLNSGYTVFMRRVVAGPGDLVRLDRSGTVWLNGKPLARRPAGSNGRLTLFREQHWLTGYTAAPSRPAFPPPRLNEAGLLTFARRFLRMSAADSRPLHFTAEPLKSALHGKKNRLLIYNSSGLYWRETPESATEQLLVLKEGHWWFKVPPDSWFVLADARRSATDSRDWGVVPRSHLIGPVLFRFSSGEQQAR